MHRWRAMVFIRGNFLEEEFSSLTAAQQWSAQQLREVDDKCDLEWRQVGSWYDLGPRPDFSARVVSIE